MIKNFFVFIITLIYFVSGVYAFEYGYAPNGYKYVKHKQRESSYQHAWCSAHNGIEEFENKDRTRVDCLTKYHAVEFDFANKWAESIGQALHYEEMTGKKAMVVLILENPAKQMVYFNRVKRLAEKYCFDAEYITPNVLHINQNCKCPYSDCKCNKI